MLSATPRQCCVDFQTLDGSTTAVKQNIADVAGTGNYYVTPEICRELKHIDNGVNHIRLDHDILKTERWNRLCNPSTTSVHKQGAINTMHDATEQLIEIKGRMPTERIHCGFDNHAREAHHLTMQDLKCIETQVRPYAHDSMVRLKQYCDDVGVTDRYTGYRNNLNRGNRQPINLDFSWYDPVNKQRNSTIKLRAESDARFNQLDRCPCVKPLTVEEQVGINITFPGISEYTDRYSTPQRTRTIDYPINPVPDFRVDGRPLGRLRQLCTETEFQARYQWPDGNKIMMFPWQRK